MPGRHHRNAQFTFSRNIETSKVIDLEKFVSHGDLDPIY